MKLKLHWESGFLVGSGVSGVGVDCVDRDKVFSWGASSCCHCPVCLPA